MATTGVQVRQVAAAMCPAVPLASQPALQADAWSLSANAAGDTLNRLELLFYLRERIAHAGMAVMTAVNQHDALRPYFGYPTVAASNSDLINAFRLPANRSLLFDATTAAAAVPPAGPSSTLDAAAPAVPAPHTFLRFGAFQEAEAAFQAEFGLPAVPCTPYDESVISLIPPSVLASNITSANPVESAKSRPKVEWWSSTSDAHLVVGIYLHGWANVDAVRKDASLLFSQKLLDIVQLVSNPPAIASDVESSVAAEAAKAALAAGGDTLSQFAAQYLPPARVLNKHVQSMCVPPDSNVSDHTEALDGDGKEDGGEEGQHDPKGNGDSHNGSAKGDGADRSSSSDGKGDGNPGDGQAHNSDDEEEEEGSHLVRADFTYVPLPMQMPTWSKPDRKRLLHTLTAVGVPDESEASGSVCCLSWSAFRDHCQVKRSIPELQFYVYSVVLPHCRAVASSHFGSVAGVNGLKRVLDPVLPLEAYSPTAKNDARRLLQAVYLNAAVREVLKGQGIVPPVVSEGTLEPALVTALKHPKFGDLRGLPVWWCPPVHDTALLSTVGRSGVYSAATDASADPASALCPGAVLEHVATVFGTAAAAQLPSEAARHEWLASIAAQYPDEPAVRRHQA